MFFFFIVSYMLNKAAFICFCFIKNTVQFTSLTVKLKYNENEFYSFNAKQNNSILVK